MIEKICRCLRPRQSLKAKRSSLPPQVIAPKQVASCRISNVSTSDDPWSISDAETEDFLRKAMPSSNPVATWCARFIESTASDIAIEHIYAPKVGTELPGCKMVRTAINQGATSQTLSSNLTRALHNQRLQNRTMVCHATGQALLAYYRQDFSVLAGVPRNIRDDLLFTSQYFTIEEIARDQILLVMERLPPNAKQEILFVADHLARLVNLNQMNDKGLLTILLSQQWTPVLFRLHDSVDIDRAAHVLKVLVNPKLNWHSDGTSPPRPQHLFPRNSASYRSFDVDTAKQRMLNGGKPCKGKERKSPKNETSLSRPQSRHISMDNLEISNRSIKLQSQSQKLKTTTPSYEMKLTFPAKSEPLQQEVTEWTSALHSPSNSSWSSMDTTTNYLLVSSSTIATPASWKTSILDNNLIKFQYPGTKFNRNEAENQLENFESNN